MIRFLSFCILLVLFLKAEAQVYHACPLHNPSEGAYENPLDQKWLSGYDVKYYDLSLSVSNLNTEIAGTATILMEAVRAMDTLVLELQDALEVSGITIGQAIDDPVATAVAQFSHTGNAIYIPLGRVLSAGDPLMVRIEYGGEAGQGRGFFAGISHAVDPIYGFDVTYTLSEPLNARDWFPVKQVLQDQIDSVHMNVACDNQLMVASNGILKEVVPVQGGKHIFRWQTRYPMAYYLLSFAVADYRDFSFQAPLSVEGDSVLVQNYIYDDNEVMQDWEEGIRRTAPLITAFSTLLRDYPFAQEKYGHAMAPLGGGMEHQTMTTLQDFSFYLVAHELAHQWFGDFVTCGNWQDIWINEGFASYMEYVAAQELRGQDAADSWMNNAMSIALGETEGSVFVPAEDVDNEYRLFDYGLSYKKGAVLLHMIRFWLSDDALFFGTLKNYLELYGNQLATGEDFREVLETTSGMDFSCFFEQWYYGEGFPRFQLHWSQSGDSLYIRSEQTGSAPLVTPFFKTPFEVKLTYTEGGESLIRLWQDRPVLDTVIVVQSTVEQLEFDPAGWLLKSVSVVNLIPEYGVEKQFVMGPNPVNDELRIRFLNNPRIDRIVVTSITGQQVWVEEDVENPVRLDLRNLTAGPYLLVMYDADRTYRQPFVKLIP